MKSPLWPDAREMRKILCMWLGEVCYSCSLTTLTCPAWAVPNYVLQRIVSPLLSVWWVSVTEQLGKGEFLGGLEPVLARVLASVGLDHVEGVGVARGRRGVPLALVVHLPVDQHQRTCEFNTTSFNIKKVFQQSLLHILGWPIIYT